MRYGATFAGGRHRLLSVSMRKTGTPGHVTQCAASCASRRDCTSRRTSPPGQPVPNLFFAAVQLFWTVSAFRAIALDYHDEVELVQAGGQRGRRERGQELGRDEQRRGRQRVLKIAAIVVAC